MDSVDAYIAQFDMPVQEVLERIRELMREEIPEGVEAISYQIPTIRVKREKGKVGNLVHFAAFKNHLSVYPRTDAVDEQLGSEIAPYASGKGTLSFRFDQ